MNLVVPFDPSAAVDHSFEGLDTDFAAGLSAPRIAQYPDHVLPVKDIEELSRAFRDPQLNAFPITVRDPEVERAIAVLRQSLASDPRAEVGPLLRSGHYSLEYLPSLLDQAVAGERWAQDARPEWEIVKAELLRNTEALSQIKGHSGIMAMLAIGSSTGRSPHCDSGEIVYCDFLGGVATLGHNDNDAKLETLRGRQGPVVVPRLAAGAQPIRFDDAKALYLRGYGNPISETDLTFANGRPFVHNAPNPNDPVNPFIESNRLVFVAVG